MNAEAALTEYRAANVRYQTALRDRTDTTTLRRLLDASDAAFRAFQAASVLALQPSQLHSAVRSYVEAA